MRKLYVANKNYSSWSMRPWVLMKQAGMDFEEVTVRFGESPFSEGSEFKKTMGALSPTALVPLLVDGDIKVWDSLSIVEYLAETFPDKKLWPEAAAQRAQARSICADRSQRTSVSMPRRSASSHARMPPCAPSSSASGNVRLTSSSRSASRDAASRNRKSCAVRRRAARSR